MGGNRDDFSTKTKDIMAKQVAFHCSNPNCRKLTCGSGTKKDGVVNIGVAAHICAAAPGGKRYDPNMTPEQRKDIENGIWLCQSCAKLIDSDEERYPVEVLVGWKKQAREITVKDLVFQPGEGIKRIESLAEFLVELPNCRSYEDFLHCESFLNGELDRLVEKMEELQRKINLARSVYDKVWTVIYERQFENTRELFGEIDRYIHELRERSATMERTICSYYRSNESSVGVFNGVSAVVLNDTDSFRCEPSVQMKLTMETSQFARILQTVWAMAEYAEHTFAQCVWERKRVEMLFAEKI